MPPGRIPLRESPRISEGSVISTSIRHRAYRGRSIGHCRHRPYFHDETRGGTIVAHSTTNWLIVFLGPVVFAAGVDRVPQSAAASCPTCSQCESASVDAGSLNAADASGSHRADRYRGSLSAMTTRIPADDRGPPCAARGLAALLPWHRCQPASAAMGAGKAGRSPLPTPAPQYSPSPFHPVPTRPVFSPRGFDPLFLPVNDRLEGQPEPAPEFVPPGETIPAPNSNESVRLPASFPEPPKPGTGWEIPDEPPPAPLPDAILSSRSSRSNGTTSGSLGPSGRMVALPNRDIPSSSVASTGSDGRRSSDSVRPTPNSGVPEQLPSAVRGGAISAGSWVFKARPTEPHTPNVQPQPILEVERPQAERPWRR